MDNANNATTTQNRTVISKKAWTAYIAPALISLVLFSILTSIHWLLGIFPILFAVYSVLMIKSYFLFLDDEGVWLYSGIFPWNKGYNGVKWRDLDEAVFRTGFFSWAFKSYTIRVSHRFTQGSEIIINHMEMGDQAVQEINGYHANFLKSNNLTQDVQ